MKATFDSTYALSIRAADAHSAAILDGHEQIGGFALAASEHGVRVPADFIVMPTLPLQEERLQYEILQGDDGDQTSASVQRRPAQNPPDMLRVTNDWSEVEILTEPYVVWTRRGYTAMIDARNPSCVPPMSPPQNTA